jgi:dTDP-4-amino-4,6-dideoxygalactose transaminase
MINVTQTFLPPLEEYERQLQRIWQNQWLTNRGELVLELENKLKNHLGINQILLTTNGTLPLQIALKTLPKGSEIITTPFTYVATTAAIVWENYKPVFVDIHPDYLTIDEEKIEAAITDRTSAILAVHVYGNPCHVERIEQIAKKYNLKVIYDAAHAFDVTYKGQSLFNYGDVSTCSFHATKLFHTSEGGAIFAKDKDLFQELYYRHNFGHKTPVSFYGVGINAKMSELQAAMGLAVLPYMNKIIEKRKEIVNFYDAHLDFTKLKRQKIREETKWNYNYYPVIFKTEKDLLTAVKNLNEKEIFPRRYFYPSLNTLEYVPYKPMPVSEDIAKRVLCLPLYPGLQKTNLNQIVNLINKSQC